MKKSRFTEEQITYALRQVESGTPPADVCRQLGCSEASFYLWKKRYGNLGITEVRELRQLRDENARLKRLVADLTLDKHILAEVVKKSSEADTATGARRLDVCEVSDRGDSVVPACRAFQDGLVSAPCRQGPNGAEDADPGHRSSASSVWLSAHPRDAQA